MIYPKLKFSPKKVISPYIESVHYGVQLHITHCVIILMLLEIAWLIAYDITFLHQDSTQPLNASIGTYHKVFSWVCDI